MKITSHKSLVTSHFKKGFTLVELIIAISIIAFVFVGGYTAYREFTRRQVVTTVAEELKVNLNFARQQAIAGEKPAASSGECQGAFLGMTVSFTSNTYSITPTCSTSSPQSGSSYITKTTLPPNVSFSPIPTNIIYKPLGQGTNITAGTSRSLTITQSGTSTLKSLTVLSSGAVQ